MTQPLIRRRADGLVAVAIQRAAPTALLSIDARVGSRHESQRDAGLSHFLEHTLFLGGPDHPNGDTVNAAAERIGAVFEACTSRNTTRLEHRVDPQHLGTSARILGGLVTAPRFDNIESERQIILEEALDEFDEDGRLVDPDTLSRQALWPKHALGRSVIGLRPNLHRFDVDDLRRHHAFGYGAGNLVLTVIGPQAPEALLATALPGFDALQPGPRRVPSPAPEALDKTEVISVDEGRSQCSVRLVWPTVGDLDLELAAQLSVLRIALDDGLSSRLHRRLGTELGLAYDQWAMWEHYPDAGAFEIGGEVSPGKVVRFIDEANALFEGLAERPLAGVELERVRFRVAWGIKSMAATAEGLVDLYGQPHLFGAQPTTPEAWTARLQAVTPAQITALATRMAQMPRVVTVVGPLDKGLRRAIRRAAYRPTRAF